MTEQTERINSAHSTTIFNGETIQVQHWRKRDKCEIQFFRLRHFSLANAPATSNFGPERLVRRWTSKTPDIVVLCDKGKCDSQQIPFLSFCCVHVSSSTIRRDCKSVRVWSTFQTGNIKDLLLMRTILHDIKHWTRVDDHHIHKLNLFVCCQDSTLCTLCLYRVRYFHNYVTHAFTKGIQIRFQFHKSNESDSSR